MKEQEAIQKEFIETLREVAFIEVLPYHGEDKVDIDKPVAAKMSVLMPYLGDVVIIFSQRLVDELSYNLFGKEEGSDEDRKRDALFEFLNVYVGRVLDQIYPDVLFELGLPQQFDLTGFAPENFEVECFVDPHESHALVYRKFSSLA